MKWEVGIDAFYRQESKCENSIFLLIECSMSVFRYLLYK